MIASERGQSAPKAGRSGAVSVAFLGFAREVIEGRLAFPVGVGEQRGGLGGTWAPEQIA